MTLLEFAHEHAFLAWLLAWGWWGLVWLAISLAALLTRLVNRLLRSIKVVLRGWPPAHLDADGDWRPRPKVEDRQP